jgi:type II secretory ATPase GspE/PulE/Tfp pilus assembly ATPase PilB-like protein
VDDESPVTKVTYAILLSALKKRASEIWFSRVGDRTIVEFFIDGVTQLEFEPPATLYDAMIRRLSVMASLPVYGKGQFATGAIHLMIATRDALFDIEVRGHGSELEARLRTREQPAERN